MKMPPPVVENQNSSLLSTEEHLQVFKLLGNRCQTVATTVVQIFTTDPPRHDRWNKKGTGVLCFVRDNSKKNYFFRLFSLKRNQMVWEHEMYNNMEYVEGAPFFHFFEGEEYLVAFNFASQPEAKNFKAVVEQKIQVRRRKEEKKAKQISQTQSLKLPQRNVDYASKQDLRKEKRRRNITKADISTPMDFVHVSHVGWDQVNGFDSSNPDAQLKSLFEKAGVSEKQLQDRETREFIYDFIKQHQDGSVGDDPSPPMVPPRGAPRPPSVNARPAPPPPPPMHRIQQSHENSAPKKSRPPSPPKQMGGGGPAPPPPPPPPPAMDNAPPPPPMMMGNGGPPAPAMPDGNAMLLQSIRDGTTLKPVEERRSEPVEDSRGDLLSAIRKGIQLKPVDEREMKPVQDPSPTSTGGNDLANALKQALFERSKVIHSEDDDDETSSTSNDDEWDD